MRRTSRTELGSRTRSWPGLPMVCKRHQATWTGVASLLLPALCLFAADDSDTNEIPALIPPRAELLPSFWEVNKTWVLLIATAAVLALGGLIWVLTRSRPPVQVLPAIQARNSLQALARRQEDRFLLSEVGRIVKGYFISAFGLPPGEFTTTEFRHRIQAVPTLSAEFSMKIGSFLERCDERKFALTSAPQSAMGAVAQASELVDAAEQLRAASENGAGTTGKSSTQPNL